MIQYSFKNRLLSTAVVIYFIKTGRYVKIGCSDDPAGRLKQLQTSSPTRLKLVATMPGSFQTECELHKVFDRFRVKGEWFRYDGQLKWCIVAIKDVGNPYPVVCVRSLQQAGAHLQIRQKRNRLPKSKLASRMKKYEV